MLVGYSWHENANNVAYWTFIQALSCFLEHTGTHNVPAKNESTEMVL